MSVQENIRLDEEFIAAWDAHDADRAVALMSEDVVWQDVASPEPARGKAAARQFMQSWFTAFPDISTVVKNRVVSEDQVATEAEFTGTNSGPLQLAPGAPAIPATGKKVTGKGVYFARIHDGKMVEMHSYPDAAGLMMQLGLVPPPAG
ncbi:MAG: ester cyclase [Chloroflexi bacterium]|nr:ester cyclase [Chloroflexota bacterium]